MNRFCLVFMLDDYQQKILSKSSVSLCIRLFITTITTTEVVTAKSLECPDWPPISEKQTNLLPPPPPTLLSPFPLTTHIPTSVSQGRICTDNFTCCHTEIEAADQTFYLTQSQYTDTGPTSPSADPITPGAWQGSHWSSNF